MENWKPYKLGEITKWFSGGTPNKSNPNFWNGEIPWISANSMHTNRIKESDLKITELGLKNGSRIAPKNSILLLVRGSGLHTRVPMGIAMQNVAFNQDVKAIIADEKIIDPWFLFAWFKSKTDFLLKSVEFTGIGAGKFDTTKLRNLVVNLPSFEEQKKIAHFAKAIDDKIELNRQMNATLEAMARTLFKAWFVDFEPVRANSENRPSESASPESAKLFPSEFENDIPKGWERKPLIEFFRLIGGGTPKTSNSDFWNGEILWYSVVDAPNNTDVFVIDTEKKITQLGLERSSTRLLRKGITIISARGTVGKLAITGSEMTMNQSCYAIEGKFGDYFNYYVVKAAIAELKQKTHGAVFDTITQDTFKSISQVMPNVKTITAFEKSIGSLMQKIEQNLRENKNLSETRDSLLPRLISGKIRVGEAENEIAQKA